jgi:hypothetical protein
MGHRNTNPQKGEKMIPQGKGIFIWKLLLAAGGDPVKMATMAHQAGFAWVAIKAADGLSNYNQGSPPTWGGPDLLGAAVAALKAMGIKVYGWQYVYGANALGVSIAKSEANVAVDNIKRFKFDGWFIDAEHQYKRKGAATWAETYMTTLRSGCPDVSLGLCSYRFPSYHPELPWSVFLRRCDFHAPQVYWINAHNPGQQLKSSVAQLTALKNLPVVPVGAAYYDPTYQWQPTVAEINEFDATAHELKLAGVTWWEWGENGHGMEFIPEFWSAISKHAWGTVLPPQDWRYEITAWARSLGYAGVDPE